MSYRYKTSRRGVRSSGAYSLEESGLLNRPRFSNLRILRRSKRMTLEKLSSLTGISPSYLSRLEQGARRLNADLMDKISGVLGCQPADLLGVSPTPLPFSRNSQASFSAKPQITDNGDTNAVLVPVYRLGTEVSALSKGQQPDFVDFDTPFDRLPSPIELHNVSKAFGLCIADSGYAPRYDIGDTVFVHPLRPLSRGCTAFIVSKNGKGIVRTFLGWQHNGLSVCFANKMNSDGTEELIIPKNEIMSVGRIVAVRSA